MRKTCVGTSAGGLLVAEGIIGPVVSVLALTWFIRYIYYWNLQFLNNIINIKVSAHSAYLANNLHQVRSKSKD